MVFFTCNNCGESLREAEKYSGKDYVPKESKNSGQRKQESWLEIVRPILATTNNSLRLRQDQAGAVWVVLEIALGKLMAQKNGEAQKNGGSSEEADGTNRMEILQTASTRKSQRHPRNRKKNRRRRKRSHKIQQAEEQNGTVAEVEENGEEPPKKKKKKNIESKTQQAEKQNGTVADVEANEVEPPKKKKKKNIEAKTENETDSATQRTNGHNEEVPEKKKSKECLEDSNAANSEKKKRKNAVLDFDWNMVIFKILGKNNDEMVLKDLKSKVLKRYRKKHQIEDIPYKVEKTFNKKIKKSGLLVEGNVVRMTAL